MARSARAQLLALLHAFTPLPLGTRRLQLSFLNSSVGIRRRPR
ncbi:MAG: hypothetical protein ABIS66_03580 [Sphingomicrobium sp.]